MSYSNTLEKKAAAGNRFGVLVALGASIGGLLYGYDTGIIAAALLFLRDEMGIANDAFLQSVVTSATVLGAILGAPLTGPMSDRFGRRMTVVIIAIFFALFAYGCAAANNLTVLIIMRFLLGLGVGGASQIIPLYISELAPAAQRGSQAVLFQAMICIGIMLAYVSGYALSPSENWRWMLGLAAIPAVLFMFVMLLLPESPRWLVAKNRIDDARNTLLRVRRNKEEVEGEITEILQVRKENSRWRDLMQPWIRPALIAGVGLAIFSQASGISAIIYYAPALLQMAGFGPSAAILSSVGVGVSLTIFTLVGIYLLDHWGRRKLVLIGLPGATAVLGIMAALLPWTTGPLVDPLSDFAKGIILICLFAYFAFNGGSLSVVIWLYCAEIFPLFVRGKGTATTAFILWTTNFIITLLLYVAADALSLGVVFAALAVINAAAFAFAFYYMPETKGRSLEDIESSLKNGTFKPLATHRK